MLLVGLPTLIAVATALMALAGIRINLTESLPRGLYRTSAFRPDVVAYGDLVTFCPRPVAVAPVAPYLIAGDDCAGPDGRVVYAELAKAIAGLPGDTVTVDATGVRVDGVPLPHSAPLAHSRSGAPVAAALGTHVLGPGEYWMHSGRVRYSLDSRYYGPVTDVRRRLRPAVMGRESRVLDLDWHPTDR